MSVAVSRKAFAENWIGFSKTERADGLTDYVLSKSGNTRSSVVGWTSIKRAVSRVAIKINLRFERTQRTREKFNEQYSKWLKGPKFKFNIQQIVEDADVLSAQCFSQASDKTKKRRVRHLLNQDHEELAYATVLSLFSAGKRISARTVNQIIGPLQLRTFHLNVVQLLMTFVHVR